MVKLRNFKKLKKINALKIANAVYTHVKVDLVYQPIRDFRCIKEALCILSEYKSTIDISVKTDNL